MGCSKSRGTLSDQEKFITKHEDSMMIYKVQTETGILTLKDHSYKETFSRNQIKMAFGKLGLDLKNIDEIDSNDAKFYNRFKDGNKYD